MIKAFPAICAIGFAFYLQCLIPWYYQSLELYWEWDDGNAENRNRIDLNNLTFPANFLWGTATAAHQIEGGFTNNNWARWEQLTNPHTGKPTISHGQKAGAACDHWFKVDEDIKLMKNLGVNSYRFSLAWSKIETSPGVFNPSAIKHYHDEIDALIQNGIVPMITLHHFTHPLWFEDAGGFEKEENMEKFVAFSIKMFEEYGKKVRYWCTINEPEVYVSMGWFVGSFPPGKKDNAEMAGIVTRNLLESHVRIYKAIKQLPFGKESQVGIVKDIFQFDPAQWWNPLDRFLASVLDKNMNGAIIDFFRTGEFRFGMPGQAEIYHRNADAPSSNDFLGLNYYSHFYVQSNIIGAVTKGQPPFLTGHKPNTLKSDMPHSIYPEGFYRAIMRLWNEGGNKPVIVTENGIADAADDRRALFIRRYLYAMSKAIHDGATVQGYFYWSLLDNFEWAEGFDMKFGLYEVDFKTQKRTLRCGSQAFVDVVKKNAAAFL